MIDFKRIAEAALQSIDTLLSEWLPDGQREGYEYKALNPTRADQRKGSFSINMNNGSWADFATDDKGGDLISLYKYLNDCSMVDAAKAVAQRLSISIDSDAPKSTPAQAKDGDKRRSDWTPVLPVPESVPEPPKAHIKRGKPSMAPWAYRDSDGRLLGMIYRFEKSDFGKEILPCVWTRNEKTGATEWRWMAFPVPRPLYGLDRLAARSDCSVLLVEGEKCADAAARELKNSVVMTWPGGAEAYEKVDWSPLAGRRVVIFPDCDAQREKCSRAEVASGVEPNGKPILPESKQPGMSAAENIAKRLVEIGCRVKIVNIPKPGEKPGGWDIADLIAEGVTGDDLAKWICGRLRDPSENKKKAMTQSSAGAGQMASDGDDEDWRRQLFLKDGRIIDCRENIHTFLTHHPVWRGVIWLDTFARKVVRRLPAPWDNPLTFKPGVEWQSHDDLRLGEWLASHEKLLVRSVENLSLAIGWAASEENAQWHPVKDYLEGLEWDGVSRIDSWLSVYAGTKRDEYTRLSGRMFLIGMVARIYQPGCSMRHMPILEGMQYIGKSSVFRILGGEWFSDTPIDLKNKDAYLQIQGRWLYEIAELDTFNRSETSSIKAFISSTVDRFRAPYDRAMKDYLRQCVFCGTVNGDDYFKDETGNTRYWPLKVEEVGQIDMEGLAAVRDSLFAEAVHLFKQGVRWWPTREEQKKYFDHEQDARIAPDAWIPHIDHWLRGSTSMKEVSMNTIIVDCLKIEISKVDNMKQMTTRIGRVMRRLGWGKKRYTSGKRDYYYIRPDDYGKDEEVLSGEPPF